VESHAESGSLVNVLHFGNDAILHTQPPETWSTLHNKSALSRSGLLFPDPSAATRPLSSP
jgi:hypothetical protein